MAEDLVGRVKKRFPGLAQFDLAVKDSRATGDPKGFRKLEFYQPEQEDNPNPGKMTVEVFDPTLQGENLERLIAADWLHFGGKNIPELRNLRARFGRSLTREQILLDRKAYDRARAGEFGYIETRSFTDWMEQHRLDQYLGATFLPEGSANRKDWLGGMTNEQKNILNRIENWMKGRNG